MILSYSLARYERMHSHLSVPFGRVSVAALRAQEHEIWGEPGVNRNEPG